MQSSILVQINSVLAVLLAIFSAVYVALRFRNYGSTDHKVQVRKRGESFRDSVTFKLGTQQLKDMVTRQFLPPIISRV